MATWVVGGVEKAEYAQASPLGVITTGDWKRIENLAPGSILMTRNVGTKSSITPEDKDKAFVNFFAAATEGDTLTLAVLEQNPELMQEIFNVKYTAATSLMEFKAAEKIANLAFRLTTRPMKDGRKCIITIYNTDVQTTYQNPLTKDQVEQPLLTASLGTYRPASETEDFVYSKQFVLADGTIIDSATP